MSLIKNPNPKALKKLQSFLELIETGKEKFQEISNVITKVPQEEDDRLTGEVALHAVLWQITHRMISAFLSGETVVENKDLPGALVWLRDKVKGMVFVDTRIFPRVERDMQKAGINIEERQYFGQKAKKFLAFLKAMDRALASVQKIIEIPVS